LKTGKKKSPFIPVMLGSMPAFKFFPVAVCINDQPAKNNQANNRKNDNARLFLPEIGQEFG